MARVTVAGTLPSIIIENTTAAGWAGVLTLSGEVGNVSSVAVSGSGASYFATIWDPAHGLVKVTPAAKIDYEMFRLLNTVPVLDFSLTISFSDGSSEVQPTNYHIAVQNIDDTPPSALAFSSGGSATAGVLGAVIGTLRVTDVETIGPFLFSFADADAWKYQVVGTNLVLKPGYSYGLDDVGTVKLPVQVSDGIQSAGFTLSITVSAPGSQADVITYLTPGKNIDGFAYAGAGNVGSMHTSSEVGYIENYGGGVHAVMMRDGTAFALPAAVTQLHFADGWVDMRFNNLAAEVYSLYQTILHRAPDPTGYADWTNVLSKGSMSLLQVTQSFMQSPEYVARIGNPSDAGFVTQLYWDAFGRAPDAGGYNSQLTRLQAGTSRAQLVDNFILSTEAINNLKKQHADGFWVPNPYGQQVAMVYEGALGRLPDPNGLANYTAKMASGALTNKSLSYEFGSSAEFLNKYAAMSDRDFITEMYHNVLHRNPDAAGLNSWTAALTNHTQTRSDMVYNFVFSPADIKTFGTHFGGMDLFGY